MKISKLVNRKQIEKGEHQVFIVEGLPYKMPIYKECIEIRGLQKSFKSL